MRLLSDMNTALSVRYIVSIDDQTLGMFSQVEGLGAEVVLETREEGGNNQMVWQIPTRLKYSNIKLTRPLGPDTRLVAAWFASMATGYTRRTATIVAMSSIGIPIAHWGLLDVIPVRWSGPSMSPDAPKVIMETVEIAHHGFIG